MIKLCRDAYAEVFPDGEFVFTEVYGTGSTDMGDLSAFMPVIHPYAGGASGNSHGANYYIVDPVAACVDCAKWQITMARMLLEGGAERAKSVVENYKAPFGSMKEFLDYQDSIISSGDRIVYSDDKAEIIL